jgi:NAD(P)-dependent dehydrogenase (short-subunit alcohol dehydrogenase family)
MGRALARRMAGRGDELFLLGRDEARLERVVRELADGAPRPPAGSALCDLEDRASFAPALDRAETALGGLDCVVLSAAVFAPQERLESDTALRDRLLVVDFANTVAFCEEARARLLARGGGTLCVFSSVAGDRGRKPVVLYGAAKAGLSRYLEGLDHRFHEQGLVVVCVKPGFVKTEMTADLDPPPFAGDADQVAGMVLRAIDRGRPVVYAPPIWRWVMLVIRWLPRRLMRRLRF